MLKKGVKSTSSLKSMLKAYSVVLLLLLYIVGSSRIESIHQLFVQHSPPVLHAVAQEADPCHRSIYHQERSSDCKHSKHFVDNHKCSMCDSQMHTAQIFQSDDVLVTSFLIPNISTPARSTAASEFYSYFSGRAPPAIS